MVSLPGQALAAQTLSIKGREERVKEMGVMSSSVHSPGDHGEESLPLPPGISGGSSIMQPFRIPENTRNVILVMNLIDVT